MWRALFAGFSSAVLYSDEKESEVRTLMWFLIISFCGVNAAAEQMCVLGQQAAFDKHVLEQKLEIWQEKLGLSDWAIGLEIVKKSCLYKETVGSLYRDPKKLVARIRVLDECEYSRKPAYGIFVDQQITVLHELVHLIRINTKKENIDEDKEEKEVERLAKSYLKKFTKPPEKTSPVILAVI